MIDLELFKKLIREKINELNKSTEVLQLRPPPDQDVELHYKSAALTLEKMKWN